VWISVVPCTWVNKITMRCRQAVFLHTCRTENDPVLHQLPSIIVAFQPQEQSYYSYRHERILLSARISSRDMKPSTASISLIRSGEVASHEPAPQEFQYHYLHTWRNHFSVSINWRSQWHSWRFIICNLKRAFCDWKVFGKHHVINASGSKIFSCKTGHMHTWDLSTTSQDAIT